MESNRPGPRALLGSQILSRRSLMQVLRSLNSSNGKASLVVSMGLRRKVTPLPSSRLVPSRRPPRWRLVKVKLKK